MTAEQMVLAAAGLLDADNPGWHRKINLGTFDLSRGRTCVIGQAYDCRDSGDFSHHFYRLIRGTPLAVEVSNDWLVFFIEPDDLEGENYEAAWVRLIRARQTADRELLAPDVREEVAA